MAEGVDATREGRPTGFENALSAHLRCGGGLRAHGSTVALHLGRGHLWDVDLRGLWHQRLLLLHDRGGCGRPLRDRVGSHHLLVRDSADDRADDEEDAQRARVARPHKRVDENGEELVHDAEHSEGRGGERLARVQTEVRDGHADNARHTHREHHGGPAELGDALRHALEAVEADVAREQRAKGEETQGEEVVVEHEAPPRQLHVLNDLFDQDGVDRHGSQVQQGVQVRCPHEALVRVDVAAGAEDDEQHGGQRLPAGPRRAHQVHVEEEGEEGHTGAHDDVRVDVRVLQQLEVGCDGDVEHGHRREKRLDLRPLESVNVRHAANFDEHGNQGGEEKLQRRQVGAVRVVHQRPLVDHHEQTGAEGVSNHQKDDVRILLQVPHPRQIHRGHALRLAARTARLLNEVQIL
eukprot:Rhum_TRINITY_DN8427_c0_g1::Rhum_TRINITY_DN8427_c0_g1_i1::g.27832::m.27832